MLAKRLLRIAVVGVLATGAVRAGIGARSPALASTRYRYTCMGHRATIIGTSHKDVIRGTNGPDVIVGLGSRDIIFGNGGNDIICGGGGEDAINGGAGNDIIEGDADSDMLYGAKGNDTIYGDTPGSPSVVSTNAIYGGPGEDHLYGGATGDVIDGGTGNDVIHGGAGNDALSGGYGPGDRIYGDRGTDTCIGSGRSGCEALPGVCPPSFSALFGVYATGRLILHNSCTEVSGRVVWTGVAPDGDLGIGLLRDDSGHLGQLLKVEFMPREVGYLARPAPGDHVTLWGAFVTDRNHGPHYELHPGAWKEIIDRWRNGYRVGSVTASAHVYYSGPVHGGDADGSNSICWHPDGSHCDDWNGRARDGRAATFTWASTLDD